MNMGRLTILTGGLALVLAPSTGLGRNTTHDDLAAYTETLPSTVIKFNMKPVAGGSVKIGGKEIAVKPFYISENDTPWEAFDAFTQSGPPSKAYDQTKFGPDAVARPSRSYILPDLGWGHHGYPAINLAFDSADMYCRWMASVTHKKYRLPTQAEWELACRQGNPDSVLSNDAQVDKLSWNSGNAGGTTHPIGTKAADKLGLFDMLGNVGNWATDVDGKPILCGMSFKDNPLDISPSMARKMDPAWQVTDPQIPKSRWWLSDAPFCGFRVVCEP